MQIGLICEGPTDVVALEYFMRDHLTKSGLTPVFRNLFPEPDNTRPEGGWSNLMLWLLGTPPHSRVARFFGGGIFGGSASIQPLDAIVIQIDADVIDDARFRSFARGRLGLEFGLHETASERASAVSEAVRVAGLFDELSAADRARHVVMPAVDSTETWCVAAFHAQPGAFEELRGAALVNAFMHALEVSESRQPQLEYQNCDKDIQRRKKFCRAFVGKSDRIVRSCPHFAQAMKALLDLTNP